jgi:hypothetical protein
LSARRFRYHHTVVRPHDHTAALTGRFASCQHNSLARPVRGAAMFGVPMAEP